MSDSNNEPQITIPVIYTLAGAKRVTKVLKI
jgi:hypothetical protein